MKRLLASLCLAVSLFLTAPIYAHASSIKQDVADKAYQNTVVIYMYDNDNTSDITQSEGRGAGVVYQTDSITNDTYIETALHLNDAPAHTPTHFMVYFSDGTIKEAKVLMQFKVSDEMLLDVKNFTWKSFTGIHRMQKGDHVFAFHWHRYIDFDGVDNFFDPHLTTDVVTGSILCDRQLFSMGWYPVEPHIRFFPMYASSFLSFPGMSGSGVYDENGYLVGIISGGNSQGSLITPILDAIQLENLGPGAVFVPWIPRESN